MEQRFENQTALVVGGANGIGRAIALRLGQEGATVIIADTPQEAEAGLAVCRQIRSMNRSSDFFECDVREGAQVNELVSTLAGRIDVLMHVAGVAKMVPFLEMDETHWDWTLDTNLKGAFLVARAVAPKMVARRQGRMVFIASTNSVDGEENLAAYNASKAGVAALVRTLARELGGSGITVNAVGPGLIRTRLTETPPVDDTVHVERYRIPMGRIGEPEDVAGPALFLASLDAAFVNGVLLYVDGGQMA
ncbi:MAG TPA: SDR family NAD(P)-dependent oxidoreductase [Terriglobia bacterium]